MLPLSEHTGYLLRVAYEHAAKTAATEMPDGPHPRLFSLMTALLEIGPISQQQLADKMRVNRTLLVGIVDQLERRGWVERRREPGDRRSYALHVTAEGERERAALAPKIKAANEQMAARLTTEERARLNALLRAFITSDPGRLVPPPLADTTGFLITQAHFLARDRANEAFRDLPIEIRHYGVLVALDELGPTSQQSLTNRMQVSATTVTQVVDVLERLDLVERRRNPTDRRSYTVSFTDEGRRVLEIARKQAERIEILGGDELRPLLRKLVGV